MKKKQRVAEMAEEVLKRQARDRVERSREPFEDALKAVLETKAGRQLEELRDGPHSGEGAQEWQKNSARSGSRSDTETKVERNERDRWERARSRSLDRSNGGTGLHLREQHGVRRRRPRGGQRKGHRPVGGDPSRPPGAAPVLSLERRHPTLRGTGLMRKVTRRAP
jgi:hypothetical protein